MAQPVNHDEDLDNRMTNLNVNAMEFVPTFLPVAPTVSAGGTASGTPTVEHWEDVVDVSLGSGTSATTPEDEGGRNHEGPPNDDRDDDDEEEDSSMETSDGHFVPSSKPRSKPKASNLPAHDATTTEKEHVNIVFIGHVGKRKVMKFSMGCNIEEFLLKSSESSDSFLKK
ncbi:hypothetical protein TCAL_14258 [Tigriopus californicus]|uniref:Uncharacterized protein n=1 Tax=Tigriopus californicus TaxID=6832 RepID=A0A553NUE3_TIGCA|nr:hypothetical protein TCAL_14258 [Tigriopus californicus]